MNYKDFSFTNNRYIFLRETQYYTRTESGKNWCKNPYKIEREIFTARNYTNFVNSIPFFNNFGNGASCRAKLNYTCIGYVPISVSSISPFKSEKHIDNFFIINIEKAREKAGYRENFVLDTATTWEPFESEYDTYTFIGDDGYTATYSNRFNQWVN